jgi:hypothetical protein
MFKSNAVRSCLELHEIEQMLEHAVVHPMRHRIQLERLMAGVGGAGRKA